ncbi:MAG: tetraacyldisaccharide 4'-kinase [Bryobacterales bacterium]|nr:tetraacyldisaccharide 4'-kinase [Bryobacterales bacterium]
MLMYWVYGALLKLGMPLAAAYFAMRAVRSAEYRNSLAERLGLLPPLRPGGLWLHAVSVGEVLSAVPLLRQWKQARPDCPVTVSVGTLAGYRLAGDKLRGLADGVVFAPVDYAWIVRRFLKALRPRLVAVMETEIWPNLWRESKRAGAGLVVVNGRISEKAFPRYRRLRWFFRTVLSQPDAILAQNDLYRQRYLELGALPAKLQVAGNLKYDFQPGEPSPEIVAFLDRVRPAAVWVAASTMPPARSGDPDEDEVVAECFLQLNHPGLLLVLAPRRPERFTSAAEVLVRRGIRFLRRSELTADSRIELPACLLLDTIGELSALFSMAHVVFMGGTLVDRGGHNILEPAFFGKPVISGPNLQNFPEIAEDFRAHDALFEVGNGDELAPAVRRLLAEPAEFGARGREVARQRTGATLRVLTQLLTSYEEAVPGLAAGWLERCVLTPLSWLWRAVVRLDRAARAAKRLPRPVVSVGGLAVGGVGKTPFAITLGRILQQTGRQPAFLTRGYARRDTSATVIAGVGAQLPVEQTGDEAQLLIRSRLGPVGIDSRRHAAGLQLLASHPADVFVLDDGFQHWPLHRDLDIVLLDAIDPLAGGAVLPLGRLREPLHALGRASAIVLMRVEQGGQYHGLENEIRRWNAHAPLFRARLVERGWVNVKTGEAGVPQGPCAAFCALGNPESFWRTLSRQDLDVVGHRSFPDHHKYTAEELNGLNALAPTLLTTEKDVMNLPSGDHAHIWFLRVEADIDDQKRFISWLDGQLALL